MKQKMHSCTPCLCCLYLLILLYSSKCAPWLGLFWPLHRILSTIGIIKFMITVLRRLFQPPPCHTTQMIKSFPRSTAFKRKFTFTIFARPSFVLLFRKIFSKRAWFTRGSFAFGFSRYFFSFRIDGTNR